MTATERAWKFIEWLGGGDRNCDCECWGHEEGEPCTDECRVCIDCQAAELLVAREQETAE